MTLDPAERPNRVPWPPILYGAAIAAALALGWLWPVGPEMPAALRLAGWAALAAGLALDLAAMVTMARARTNILPHRAAGRLVTGGPFRFTRNPIYLGNTILTAGIGLASSNAWFLAAAAAAAVAVDRLAIRREERHLAARFGAEWATYAARVPRWIGPVAPAPPSGGTGA